MTVPSGSGFKIMRWSDNPRSLGFRRHLREMMLMIVGVVTTPPEYIKNVLLLPFYVKEKISWSGL